MLSGGEGGKDRDKLYSARDLMVQHSTQSHISDCIAEPGHCSACTCACVCMHSFCLVPSVQLAVSSILCPLLQCPASCAAVSRVQCSSMLLPPAAQVLCQVLVLHGLCVEEVLRESSWANVPRNLDCLEVFAGVGSVAAAAAELGLRSATYDKHRVPGNTETTEDLSTEAGLRTAIALVMRLAPSALLWLAPVCRSWGFMNSSRCKRKAANGFEGDTTYPPVIEGNALVAATVFLMLLAAARGVRVAMENPVESTMFRYPLVVRLEAALHLKSAIAYRCAYSSAPYGKRYLKGYRFMATGTWIRGVAAKCKCPNDIHLPLTRQTRAADGSIKITGIRARLRESGAYPLPLGRKIVQCASPGRPLQQSESWNDAPSSVPRPVCKNMKKNATKNTAGKTQSAAELSSTKGPVWLKPMATQSVAELSSNKGPAWLKPMATQSAAELSSTKGPAWLKPMAAAAPASCVQSPASRTAPTLPATHRPAWCSPPATGTSAPSSKISSASPAWWTPSVER